VERKATVTRKTKETEIEATVNLDGSGASTVATGMAFLDHMLDQVARHSGIDIAVKGIGDYKVDYHHTCEDVGICLGQALLEAVGDKAGIRRFGYASAPMDDALANVTLDLSGRPYLVYNVPASAVKIGDFDPQLIEEFMTALAFNAKINLHVNVPYGKNAHHIKEAIFKALAIALRMAVGRGGPSAGVPSTKGVL